MKKSLLRCAVAVVLVTACFFVNQALERAAPPEDTVPSGRRYDSPVDAAHPALVWFADTYENRETFLGFAGDLTEDGREDLVILFHEGGETRVCWMTVAVRREDDGWTAAEPVRAPVENQQVRLFDMDGAGPLEWVVTGEKDGEVGYAIFRFEGGKPVNLFADGMEDCC